MMAVSLRGGMVAGSLIGVMLSLCTAVPARADGFIDFDQIIDGGTISYGGGGGPLSGANIRFDLVKGIGTPVNSGVTLLCNDPSTPGDEFCLLNFTTGNNITEGATSTFDSGGSFTLEGSLFNGGGLITTGTLLSGSFSGSPSIPTAFVGNVGGLSQVTGFGADVKNDALAQFFGYTTTDFLSATNVIADTTANDPGTGAFAGDVVESDLANAPVVAEPEFASLVALAFLALGLFVRSRPGGVHSV